ncbi:MAG: hypothetical protein AB7P69_17040 [Candidatus Binatia bacterium]
MKTKVQKLIGLAILGVVLFSNSIPAWAGAKSLREVLIKDFATDSSASGTTAGARYSGDKQQYIGCNLLKNGGPAILCVAQDKTGKSLVCIGNHPKWMAAAKAITDFSQIYFVTDRNNASCKYLEIQNDSLYFK